MTVQSDFTYILHRFRYFNTALLKSIASVIGRHEFAKSITGSVCKFKISLALEFKEHVLTFGSYDNNTRVYWYSAEDYAPRHWDYIPFLKRDDDYANFGVHTPFNPDVYLADFDTKCLVK
ncbi:hypothetical protein ARMGADRAFT_1089841 [Armillaria gallica]|uniref:Uncharacterized protein n=1 Tax=Armillaria gallica TaxID=47427 RepID=A0A2H3CIL6_ARMGA|nr:hypothetical protein ARMGADRAFT_1089841 [Armillaria gallica]